MTDTLIVSLYMLISYLASVPISFIIFRVCSTFNDWDENDIDGAAFVIFIPYINIIVSSCMLLVLTICLLYRTLRLDLINKIIRHILRPKNKKF